FDALNDARNMERAIRAVRRAGKVAQGTICYTQSPVHSLEAFVGLAKRLAELGADEICLKDMAGFLPPTEAKRLTEAIRREVGLPVVLHTHSSSGMSTLACLAAADAGAAAVDAALSPFSGGASQPPTESLVGAMRGTSTDPGLDLGALAELADYFRGVLDHYRPLLDPRSLMTDPSILVHQVPGGMLSNLLAQLKGQDALGRLSEVLEEIPRVRSDLGYPPLVTPTSQIVGIQAVLNVLLGHRYREITREVRDYVKGLYGTPPGPIDPELSRAVLGSDRPIAGRPADLLGPEFPKALEGVRALVPAADDAEALSYALFPMVYEAYRADRDRGITLEVVTAAALGVVGALRSDGRRTAPGVPEEISGGRPQPPHPSAWVLAGRSGRPGSGRRGWA
ncbi:MAG TPA: pyruvate carboxylase subunit B, partial [Thermoplasmata archaeon]|nr:pyruvate carboxylase subunit B [Thermoplasmata archaeon]